MINQIIDYSINRLIKYAMILSTLINKVSVMNYVQAEWWCQQSAFLSIMGCDYHIVYKWVKSHK